MVHSVREVQGKASRASTTFRIILISVQFSGLPVPYRSAGCKFDRQAAIHTSIAQAHTGLLGVSQHQPYPPKAIVSGVHP
jgi:hypothetical protein